MVGSLTKSQTAPEIDALLFDMDGLLLDTERVALDTFVALATPLGLDAATAELEFLHLVGTSYAVTEDRVAALFPNHNATQLMQDWSAAMDKTLADAVPLRPHVAELVPKLAALGRPMAVVTSTQGDRARAHLDHAGLLPHFNRVLGGDEVRANKPDPAPYLEAAAALGVTPTRAAAFEDSDRGVTAAVAAGCHTVQIPDLRPPGQPLPDLGQAVARDLRYATQILGLFSG